MSQQTALPSIRLLKLSATSYLSHTIHHLCPKYTLHIFTYFYFYYYCTSPSYYLPLAKPTFSCDQSPHLPASTLQCKSDHITPLLQTCQRLPASLGWRPKSLTQPSGLCFFQPLSPPSFLLLLAHPGLPTVLPR